jgi:hypothetical protein
MLDLSEKQQALKYLLQGRLTKCPMTLSLGRSDDLQFSFDSEISLNDTNEYQHNVLILNGK